MKAKQPVFRVRPFKNPSGQTVYQVDGFISGKRIRQNFPSRKEALAGKDALELKAVQAADANLRMVGTYLRDEEVRESESVFLRIRNDCRTLTELVDFALANHKAPETQKPLAGALDDYLAHRTAEHGRGLISKPQLTTIRRHVAVLKKCFPKTQVSDLTGENLTAYCSRENASLKTHNNRRGVVSTFLKYAYDKGWIATNPIDKVPHYRIGHKRGTAATLTAEKAAGLMAYLETYLGGRLVPFYALALFAGLRPDYSVGELSKIKADAIKLDTGVICVEPEVSKVGMKRNVTIQPNLAAWLKAYPLDKFPILAKHIGCLRTRIAKKFGLSYDVLRHTFISMHVAKFRSMGDTALEAGNSEEIIRKHYLDVKSKAEAEAFFSIMPSLRQADDLPPAPSETSAMPPADTAFERAYETEAEELCFVA